MSRENEQTHPNHPGDMHHVLAFARLVISDSQSMSSEAAVLGIPALRYNSFMGRIGYLNELENRYRLGFGFVPGQDDERFLSKIEAMINTPIESIRGEWQERRQYMLSEKIDLTQWMIEFFSPILDPKSINAL